MQSHTGQRQTEAPHCAARGVAALVADPEMLRHTGRVLDVGELARLYGFTDPDGAQSQSCGAQRSKPALVTRKFKIT